ncbi:hypothetical protein C2W62_11465 [Candidatus Entotheonella serta]|nr:hypothetical protein C2W62_11465 [Candidatus Entotheonella serta]
MLRRQGRNQQALLAFRRTIEYDPKSAEAWRAMAALYYQQNQLESARDAFV